MLSGSVAVKTLYGQKDLHNLFFNRLRFLEFSHVAGPGALPFTSRQQVSFYDGQDWSVMNQIDKFILIITYDRDELIYSSLTEQCM